MFIFLNCSHCLYKLKAMCPMIDTAMRRILNELPKSGRVSLCVSILTGRKKKIDNNQ